MKYVFSSCSICESGTEQMFMWEYELLIQNSNHPSMSKAWVYSFHCMGCVGGKNPLMHRIMKHTQNYFQQTSQGCYIIYHFELLSPFRAKFTTKILSTYISIAEIYLWHYIIFYVDYINTLLS